MHISKNFLFKGKRTPSTKTVTACKSPKKLDKSQQGDYLGTEALSSF